MKKVAGKDKDKGVVLNRLEVEKKQAFVEFWIYCVFIIFLVLFTWLSKQ